MRWRGVNHVEFAVREYQSIYYMTRNTNPHSYIGIQPARRLRGVLVTDEPKE
ncbi:MAG: hypothetical protein VYA67_05885 [Actinomycetota bacterium]|uniref:Uncharacterized protein n=1 Tax=Mycobacterium lentiflavum TaxID=141349 RepID=A0ABY3UP87_MYCLN|nr:hypothetical protein [Mycobacterium lentiflavum]MEE3063481.1 hypothetical protein [Actinomycetota bacterium]ULP41395.1 hypothetical protein MJO58_21385 [Mycobacterium lentiflavum]